MQDRIRDEKIIAGLIMKCFTLKCLPLENTVLLVFAEEAIAEGFTPDDIEKACREINQDSQIRKVIYGDIHDRAKIYRYKRREEQQRRRERLEMNTLIEQKQEFIKMLEEEKNEKSKKNSFN